MTLADWIKERGRALGFNRVGIAPASDLPELAFFAEWRARGYAGTLDYLHQPRRADVRRVLPRARSVICCALVYDTDYPRSTELPPNPECGWISRYAWGDDYHDVLSEKLGALQAAIAEKLGPGFESKLYVDTGPVLERVYGKYAGLGWQAKNTCLLDAELGSFFFVGVLVTNLEVAPDEPLPDGCGACTLCIEACPTAAIVEPYLLDARRCISYLTIELRAAIPEEFRASLGRHVFGCDICQDVCPYNRRAWLSEAAAFQPRQIETRESKRENRAEPSSAAIHTHRSSATEHRPAPPALREAAGSPVEGSAAAGTPACPTAPAAGEDSASPTQIEPSIEKESFFHPRLEWLASLSEEEFGQAFKNSPVKRAKRRGLLRNALIAMGNSGKPGFRRLLEKFAAGQDPLLAEHAEWALKKLQGP